MGGGGARAAYQVGVIKAMAAILPKDSKNPFPIICGTSAGAINAATLAVYAREFNLGVKRLNYVWKNFRTHQVFRVDAKAIAKNMLHWLAAILSGGLGKHNPASLLDRSPLEALIPQYVPCEKIQESIDSGVLEALNITALSYDTGLSVNFYQTNKVVEPWERVRRVGVAERITAQHLLASCAMPYIFPAVEVDGEYYGDGSMRQIAPISPALHLGARRIVVIGAHNNKYRFKQHKRYGYPTLGQIAGQILNSIFLDSIDLDIERLQRINNTIDLLPSHETSENGAPLQKIEFLVVSPSEDIQRIAEEHIYHVPKALRFLLRGIGGLNHESASLLSYLLFEGPYCRDLIALGYADAMQRKDEIEEFLRRGQEERA